MKLEPGEIVLEHASRAFSVRADQGRTLKGLLIGRRRGGVEPPPVQALRDVSMRVGAGETVGIVGRNGAGKSSTLGVLAGIVPLDSGRSGCGGRVVTLLELGAGFGRDFSGRENIYLNGALHGFTQSEIEQRIDRIIDFSELGHFIDVPVRTYSSGMFVRLGFSIAAYLDADVLLIDEVLAVGDEGFQRKCLRRISERIAAGATIVLVSHDPGAIERVCDRVVVLEAGAVVYDGSTAEGLLFYHRLIGTLDASPQDARRPDTTAPLHVSGLELRDSGDRRSQIFHSGQSARIVLSLQAQPGFSQATAAVALELRDEHGSTVFRTRGEPELRDGRADVAYEIERLALLGGDYDLAVAVADQQQFARVTSFSVAHEPGAEGIADLRGSWKELAASDRAPTLPTP
ncbi:MAG TPA: polysaccharide ABC transporter ATP-binding protein [Solirubrobacteraceae bacterium]|nr:polysaccharide ABC transporter ATP-binding protein [Solirubrobacteraceae bacterium]